jgi:hypothetical protein
MTSQPPVVAAIVLELRRVKAQMRRLRLEIIFLAAVVIGANLAAVSRLAAGVDVDARGRVLGAWIAVLGVSILAVGWLSRTIRALAERRRFALQLLTVLHALRN